MKDKEQEKKQPKCLHRKVHGYGGNLVSEGCRTSIYLPESYMKKVKEVAKNQGVSVSEWMRSLVIGVMDSGVMNKFLDTDG